MSLPHPYIKTKIKEALKEDAADRDITTDTLVKKNHRAKAVILVKEQAVICGLEIARDVFRQLDRNIQFSARCADGHSVKANTVIAAVHGPTHALLRGERVALNFLTRLSGIATQTRWFVQAASSPRVKILDTRKTTPGWRLLERYAVRCGGGMNHRFDLSDMVLVKDNHFAVCGCEGMKDMIRLFRQKTKKCVEVEVTHHAQLQQALTARPDIILLDNMRLTQIKQAVKMTRAVRRHQRPLLEVSGGVTLRNIKAIAETGVDRISVGALTHTYKSIDISLEILQS